MKGKVGSPTALRPAICRAFTLVELLVVIGIIALLISVLLPALNKAREEANLVKCQANLRSIGQAMQIYVDVYKGLLPEGQYDNSKNVLTGAANPLYTTQGMGDGTDWTVLLQSVMTSNSGNTWGANANGNAGQGGIYAQTRLLFTCPEAPQGSQKSTSGYELSQYASNPRLMPQLGEADPLNEVNVFVHGCYHSYPISKIKRSSEIALIFDATLLPLNGDNGWSVSGSGTDFAGFDVDYDAVGLYGGGYQPYMTDNYQAGYNSPQGIQISPGDPISMVATGAGSVDSPLYANQDVTQNQNNIRFRHLGNTAANVLFVDGHVETFTFNNKLFSSWVASPYSPIPAYTNLLRKNFYVNYYTIPY